MHPMFMKLFMEPDADDLLTEEQDRRRHAPRAKRLSSSRVLKAAPGPDRPRRR